MEASAIGDSTTAATLHIITDEYVSGKIRVDKEGLDTINLAAVTKDVTLDLGSETVTKTSKVGGKDLLISAETVIEKAFLGDGDDSVTGNGAANLISGGRGNDVLDGVGGSDSIVGGAGADVLGGGSGADKFIYTALSDSSELTIDRIFDFASVQGDIIDLSEVDAVPLTDLDDVFVFVNNKQFTVHEDGIYRPGELRYEAIEGGTRLLGNTDSDNSAEFELVLLNLSSISAESLLL